MGQSLTYGDYIQAAADAGTNPVSISFWMATRSKAVNMGVAARAQTSSSFNGYTLYLNDASAPGKFVLIGKASAAQVLAMTGTAVINDGNWHHIGMSIDYGSGATTKLYVDGVLDASAASSGAWGGFSLVHRFGRVVSTFLGDFVGSMAEIAMWDNVLLGADEFVSLAKGFRADLIRPASLTMYTRGIRDVQDIKGSGIATSGLRVIDHPYQTGVRPSGYSLDAYTTGLWACYGLNRLLTSYTGNLIRVRRSSDNTEQDIGQGWIGQLDTAALSAFVGANNGFITKWYDQSGSGNDMAQTTQSRQPRIVNSGTYDGAIVFNPGGSGGDDYLVTTATGSSSVAAKSIFRRVNWRATSGNSIEFEYGDSGAIAGASGANQLQVNDVSSTQFVSYIATNSTGTAYWQVSFNPGTWPATSHGFIFLKGQANAGASLKLYAKGASQSGSSGGSGSPTTSGNFPAYTWGLGNRGSALNIGAQIDMYNCAIYDADKSSDALAINAILDNL